MVRVPHTMLEETHRHLRGCGGGRRECQTLWLSRWEDPETVTGVVHPEHSASAAGFQLAEEWLTRFWNTLAQRGEGVRVQVHTHPGAAYHSATDDRFPIHSTPGLLSLVVPRFATGPSMLDDAFLARLDPDGRWREVPIHNHLEISR